jgi:hypothetical protein
MLPNIDVAEDDGFIAFFTAAFTVGTHSAMKGCIGTGAECGKFRLEVWS